MKSLTQQLLAEILEKHKCSISEAWEIYRRKYEDKELDPKRISMKASTSSKEIYH